MEGWGREGSHEVADKGYINTENSQITSNDAISTSAYYTKQLNPCPNSSTSHVVNYSWLFVCQEDHPSTHGRLTSLRIKPQQEQSGQVSAPILG